MCRGKGETHLPHQHPAHHEWKFEMEKVKYVCATQTIFAAPFSNHPTPDYLRYYTDGICHSRLGWVASQLSDAIVYCDSLQSPSTDPQPYPHPSHPIPHTPSLTPRGGGWRRVPKKKKIDASAPFSQVYLASLGREMELQDWAAQRNDHTAATEDRRTNWLHQC